MTPKEKAKELVYQFCLFTNGYNTYEKNIKNAKKCASIVVTEIIKSRKNDDNFDDFMSVRGSDYYTPHPLFLTYWQEVNQEIENL